MQQAAIVILNYNGEKTLAKFLPSVVKHSTFPIFVADNASTDHSVEVLKENFLDVKLILLDENHGYAGGYNLALEKIQGNFSYYILLNSDVEVSENWDKILIDYLDAHPNVAGVQPKILSYSNPEFFEHAGAGGGYIDELGYPYCRGRLFNSVEKDNGQYDDEVVVDWVSGACMAVRADSFHSIGGFDPSYFAHMEEIDWCWRLRCQGYVFKYLGSTWVFHQGASTLSRSNPKKTFLNFRNNLSTLKKNLPASRWKKVYFLRIFLDALAAISFLFNGGFRHSLMVAKAHLNFHKVKHFSNTDSTHCKGNGKIRFLVWTYYIKGIKKYS